MITFLVNFFFSLRILYRMQGKNSKDSSAQKQFLIGLIEIFQNMQEELKRLPFFDSKYTIELKRIKDGPFLKNSVERRIKRQQQTRLFQQTLKSINEITKRRLKGRKSEVVMKFSMVSDIFLQRMREQLCIQGQAKQIFLQSIINLKDSFSDWGQRAFQRQKMHEHKQHSREHQKYSLKYIYSELATTNPSLNNSKSISRYQQNDTIPTKNKEEQKEKQSRFKNPRRKTVENRRNTFTRQPSQKSIKRSTYKGYTNNQINTSYQNANHPDQTSNLDANNCRSQKNTQRSRSKKTTFYQNAQDTQINQQEKENTSKNIDDSNLVVNQQKEEKKSAYYISQNYIRSRKNIQNITLFVSKTRKRISNFVSNAQLSCQESISHDLVFMQPSEGFKNRKFLTKKYIPPQNKQYFAFKTDHSINTNNHNPNNPKSQYSNPDKKFIPKKKPNQNLDDIQQIKLQNPNETFQAPIRNLNPFKLQNKVQLAMENRTQTHPLFSGKPIQQFYDQMKQLQASMKKQMDPVYQTRSIFFQQQNYLWQEQKRRMQNILEQRRKLFYFREFQMNFMKNSRDQQQALRALRNDFFKFAEKNNFKNRRQDLLQQTDPNHYSQFI